MKQLQKMMALLLAVMLVLSLSVTAFAETTHTLTINGNATGHTYTAYQVFAGTLNNGKDTLSDVEWGSGVKRDELLTALQGVTAFADCESAADVAEVLSSFDNDSDALDAFAAVVAQHLDGSGKESSEGRDAEGNLNKVYTISGLADGYYFVKDKEVTGNDAYTKFMLQITDDATAEVKSDFPSITKKINEGSGVDYNNASIGDTVPYILNSTVPNMDGYDSYIYQVVDTMSKGLTFKENSVKVYIDGTELAADKFVVNSSTNGDGVTTITIYIKNFISYTEGAAIKITYSATLNENAVIGIDGNPNTAKLVYSNNPNVKMDGDGNGEPDWPDDEIPKEPITPGTDPEHPIGTTPEDTVITYVTGIEIDKIDAKTDAPLAGAKFQITGTTVNTVLVTSQVFAEDANGTYWKLKDGSYTTTAPTDDTTDDYASTTIKYALNNVTSTVETSETVKAEAVTGPDGKLVFKGLSAGEYTITELIAPDGYNKLANPITVTIGWSAPEAESTTKKCTWTTDKGEVKDGIVVIEIENKAGSKLPSTGGMGTTAFYLLGSMMCIGALTVLVAKKRMSAKDY